MNFKGQLFDKIVNLKTGLPLYARNDGVEKLSDKLSAVITRSKTMLQTRKNF
ncbi:MAG: hypothetical protein ACI9TO_001274 [Rickettsiales bacterium]|jgi:hypothetical protein